jgi:hypothetical protein
MVFPKLANGSTRRRRRKNLTFFVRRPERDDSPLRNQIYLKLLPPQPPEYLQVTQRESLTGASLSGHAIATGRMDPSGSQMESHDSWATLV